MTFGLPRDAIPLDEVTGTIKLEYNVAILEAIEAREKDDRVMEQQEHYEQETLRRQHQQLQQLQNELDDAKDELVRLKNEEEETKKNDSERTTSSKDELWMSLSASVGSSDSALSDSFALFPDILDDDDVENLVQKMDENDADNNIDKDRDRRRGDDGISNGYDNNGVTNSNRTDSSDLFALLEAEDIRDQQGKLFPPTLSLSSLPENPTHQLQHYFPLSSSSSSQQQSQQQQQQQRVLFPSEQQHHLQRFNSYPETAPSSSSVAVENFATAPTSSTLGVTTSSSTAQAVGGGDNITTKANPYDIIMGRGQWNKFHPGNIRFKDTLASEREQYEAANRFERMRIVDKMVDDLTSSRLLPPKKTSTGAFMEEPAPRFLYQEKDAAGAARTNAGNVKGKNNTRGVKNNKGQQEQLLQGPWLIATREKSHDKITHDFRNMRRNKQPSRWKQIIHDLESESRY